MRSHFGDTIILRDLTGADSAQKLSRVRLRKGSEGAAYDEAWLQKLIMAQPGLIPVGHIEPVFLDMVPVCTELPMKAGFADNLFITPTGHIALIECKLWRNPKATREVVAQIIDYASELATWSYEQLEGAVKRSTLANAPMNQKPGSLFEIVSPTGDSDEVAFHDAVSRNLKLGRILLLIVGDGIREGLETLTDFLHRNAGLHFTLSIVEIALFELPAGGFLVQPRILARTTNIIRGVVTLSDSRMEMKPALAESPGAPVGVSTISQEQFFDDLERNSPGGGVKVRAFVIDIAAYHVMADYGSKTLILRWHLEDAVNWNLGTIVSSGEVWMDYHAVQARNSNRLDASKQYLEDLAALVPGASVKQTKSGGAWNVCGLNGHSLRIQDLLADDMRKAGWIRAIQQFQLTVADSTKA